MPSLERYRFGEFYLDAAERSLFRGCRAVPLTPKAFELLLALVRNAGHLMTKDELLDQVWPHSFVEEGILSVHISTLRNLLGDRNGTRRYIDTVSGAGYRFIAPVTRPEAKPVNPEVHEWIGRGRAHLLSASMAEMPKAVEAFRAAIALDPNYAAAHAGLAMAYCAQAEFRVQPHLEAYAAAKPAALAALALDESCADAQVALGSVLFLGEWDWAGAEQCLARAIELNPSHTEARLLFGRLLEATGQFERALAMKQKALERDPQSPLVHLQISMCFWNQRRYEESIEWANKALALDPRHLLAREHLAGAYWKLGDFDRQMAEMVKHCEAYGVPASTVDGLKRIYAEGGRAGVVRTSIEMFSKQPNGGPAMQLAILNGEAGELDAAFRHLDRALESRDPCLVYLAVAPQWDPLRADPRFADGIARMGLPVSAVAA